MRESLLKTKLFGSAQVRTLWATTAQMRSLRESVQAQTPPDGTQKAAQRGKTVSVREMPEAVFSFRFLQSAHEPQVLLL